MTEKPVLHSSEEDKAKAEAEYKESRLAEPQPVKAYVPPSKGPVEKEVVEGLTDVKCAHCGHPITGRYRTAFGKRYHYPDAPEATTGYQPCKDAWQKAVENTGPYSSPDMASRIEAETRSANGVPVSEIRENMVPSQAKVMGKLQAAEASYEASRPASEPGRKDDGAKVRYSLLPWAAVTEVVKVLEHGARKYAVDNWRKVPEARQRYADAAMRHKLAYESGEMLDPESGLPHKAHEACCNLFILALDLSGVS